MILKTGQLQLYIDKAIVHVQWDRYTSYDVIKHHMIVTKVDY